MDDRMPAELPLLQALRRRAAHEDLPQLVERVAQVSVPILLLAQEAEARPVLAAF